MAEKLTIKYYLGWISTDKNPSSKQFDDSCYQSQVKMFLFETFCVTLLLLFIYFRKLKPKQWHATFAFPGTSAFQFREQEGIPYFTFGNNREHAKILLLFKESISKSGTVGNPEISHSGNSFTYLIIYLFFDDRVVFQTKREYKTPS